ncbi:Crp/Fnr family transcriptional regulator [Actimicrobium sp. CCI2.3]|uniref:Crp/Fnr family transcriptional regulator n=1 Tax=Actimicrobium sp. CCI2.3 TaxID=3048616 RepID=UPI002AB53501|nr:Crp/Fnr family transcriptional regulator [Actimicrobium sp. CCI2.3]MDY7573529.1 Crp/Fnr family transcriptional regulator [Actimicrobium sp. CCI2.3]MEB0022042.1 Crp/Fnr family transcriptional regulator [Actimicrobium sp. CCI2.3]
MLAKTKRSGPANSLLAVIAEFRALQAADLDDIGRRCQWRNAVAGEVVLHYQDDGDSIFFIIQGTIRLTHYAKSGHEVILGELSAGDMFGELAAIDGQRRSATGVARTDTLLAIMPAAAFLDLIQTNPQIAMATLRRLSGQVRRLTERVFDFSTLAVRNRIHAALLQLAKDPVAGTNQAIITPAPTHIDLANMISTHREAVTRELNELVRDKLIRREEHSIVILDIERLRRMVQAVRG